MISVSTVIFNLVHSLRHIIILKYHRLKKIDIGLNVLCPLLIGALFYIGGDNSGVNKFIRNHLPDGLWAYALISSILIIWNRQIQRFWIYMAYLIFLGLELLQHFQIINGTADVLDVVVYFVCSVTGILLNKYFSHLYNPRV